MQGLTPWNWFKKHNVPVRRGDWFPKEWAEQLGQDFSNLEDFLSSLNSNLDFQSFITSFKDQLNFSSAIPKIDISEDAKQYLVEAELPGVKEEDVDISVSKDGVLIIKGTRKKESEQNERNYYKIERSHGSFQRALTLPSNCDLNNIKASYNNSLVTITIPKKEHDPEKIKKIEINK